MVCLYWCTDSWSHIFQEQYVTGIVCILFESIAEEERGIIMLWKMLQQWTLGCAPLNEGFEESSIVIGTRHDPVVTNAVLVCNLH